MTTNQLATRLSDALRNERHATNAETRYWCDQYRQIAIAAIQPVRSVVDTVAIATVEHNACDCHPETCCCQPAALRIFGSIEATGSYDGMSNIAKLLNDHIAKFKLTLE
jgi:hypothetical protein